jgi:hypothetical protein
MPLTHRLGMCLRSLSLSSLPSSRALGTRSGSRLTARNAIDLPVSSRRSLGPFSWSVCPGRGTAAGRPDCEQLRGGLTVRPCASLFIQIQTTPRGSGTNLTAGLVLFGNWTCRSQLGRFQLGLMQTGADGSLCRKDRRMACAGGAFVISRSEVRILSPAPAIPHRQSANEDACGAREHRCRQTEAPLDTATH